MAITTQIRTDQVRDSAITAVKIADGVITNSKIASGTIIYSNLSATAVQNILESKLQAYGKIIEGIICDGGTGSSSDVDITANILAVATTPTSTINGTELGIWTTGTGANGVGTQNYKVSIRDPNTKFIINDGVNRAIYGELHEYQKTSLDGTISYDTGSTTVTGTGTSTLFESQLEVGWSLIYDGQFIGIIESIENDYSLTLTTNALISGTDTDYESYRYELSLKKFNGDDFIFSEATTIDVLYWEVFNEYTKSLKATYDASKFYEFSSFIVLPEILYAEDDLSSQITGTETVFVVNAGVYQTQTLKVYVDGIRRFRSETQPPPTGRFYETDPGTGTFELAEPPELSEEVWVEYI